MGSLTSRPELPQAQQPVIITIPSSPAPLPSAVLPSTSSDSSASAAPTDEEIKSKAREENLLQRSRGALSTVLTGFNGIISQTVTPSSRKTLLGE